MKVLRINTITSDGVKVDDTPIVFHPLDVETGRPYLEDDGITPSVELVLRPVTRDRERLIVQARTERVVVNGAMVEKTDFEGIRDDKVLYAVVSWKGFIGADNKPLPCVDATKAALDWLLKNAIVDRATRAEPVEVTAASFRESASVS